MGVFKGVRALVVLVLLVGCGKEPPVRGLGFSMPLGEPDGRGSYDAQPFGTNRHLGADLNGPGGGDTDLGMPVYAIADGEVVFAADAGPGWGNVVRVVHRLPEGGAVESVYAHLLDVEVRPGARVTRRKRIGSVGNAGGRYKAHLHLELRRAPGLPLGGGYGDEREREGYVDPVAFIQSRLAL
jgi:murein DD-endopeptidase MepM/ murein hydrolase activator NlpD